MSKDSLSAEDSSVTGIYWLGLVMTMALFVYLLVALLRPDKF